MKTLLSIFNLHHGEDEKELVLETVRNNISFRGANLWILACAIVIASVGLNVNSTAVIIGAMLISPLMGPIIGAGFSLSIYDFDLFKKSLKNLLVATIVSLVVSTLYFLITPYKQTQPELLARTSPNIYDILIAFFGGVVGAVAITRKEKGNPIPGVAIATALMPPLCTAGYGLAVANWKFLAGALYLYTINCVFICTATFIIIKLLRYPRKTNADKVQQKRITFGITTLTLVLLIPSIYFAYSLVENNRFNDRVNKFLQSEFTKKGYVMIYKNASRESDTNRIDLAFLTKRFSPEQTAELQSRLSLYGLNNTKLVIHQDTSDLNDDVLNQLAGQQENLTEKDILISNLRQQLAVFKFDNQALLSEIRVLFPEVEDFSVSLHEFHADSVVIQEPVAIYVSRKELSPKETEQLSAWLKARLQKPKVQVIRMPQPE